MAVRPRQSASPWIHRRRCLYCGEDGMAIQVVGDGAVFRCPTCRGDLYSRPPRSYAELEGLDTEPQGRPNKSASVSTPAVRTSFASGKPAGLWHPWSAAISMLRAVAACVTWIIAIRRGARRGARGLVRGQPTRSVEHRSTAAPGGKD